MRARDDPADDERMRDEWREIGDLGLEKEIEVVTPPASGPNNNHQNLRNLTI